MLLTKKLACPSCSVKLKVADTLSTGKVITCPKCGTSFPVPEDSGDIPSLRGARTRSRRAAAPPDEDEAQDEDTAARPKLRKRRKKPQQTASNTPLVLGLVIGGAVSLLIGVILIMVLHPSGKAERAAVSTPSPSTPVAPPARLRPGPPGAGMLAQRPGAGEPGPGPRPEPSASQPEQRGPSEQSRPTGGESDLIAVGQSVFRANNCGRCHTMGAAPGGGMRGRGSRGPDLSRVGANPSRTVDWLMEQIRDPQSHRPDSRMAAYAGKIGDDDLRALAVYLASLK